MEKAKGAAKKDAKEKKNVPKKAAPETLPIKKRDFKGLHQKVVRRKNKKGVWQYWSTDEIFNKDGKRIKKTVRVTKTTWEQQKVVEKEIRTAKGGKGRKKKPVYIPLDELNFTSGISEIKHYLFKEGYILKLSWAGQSVNIGQVGSFSLFRMLDDIMDDLNEGKESNDKDRFYILFDLLIDKANKIVYFKLESVQTTADSIDEKAIDLGYYFYKYF